MQDILIESLMSVHVETGSRATTVRDAAHIMHAKKISCILVTENDTPIGIFSERDLTSLATHATDLANALEQPIVEHMSTPVTTIKQTATLFEALVVMRAEHIRHLPVVNIHNKVIGIATETDMVKAQFQMFESLQHLIENSITKRLQELIRANEELKSLSMEDSLLGIGNRRAMTQELIHTHASSVRYKRPYSVIMVDVDNFKRYNDYYGHPAGDYVLKKITDFIQSAIRTSDRLYRYGGEELLVLLPETPPENAKILADRLVQRLYEQGINHRESQHKVVTVSAGIAGNIPDSPLFETYQQVVDGADRALYQAKESGRNQAMVYTLAIERQADGEPNLPPNSNHTL